MQAADTQQREELRLAFLRHLPRRIDVIAQRTRRFFRDGWDINGLSLLYEDVQRLAGAAGRYGEVGASERLVTLETLLGEFLDNQTLPDAEANGHLAALVDSLAPDQTHGDDASTGVPNVRRVESDRIEVAPPRYWRRWVGDAPAATVRHDAQPANDPPAGALDDVAAAVETSHDAAIRAYADSVTEAPAPSARVDAAPAPPTVRAVPTPTVTATSTPTPAPIAAIPTPPPATIATATPASVPAPSTRTPTPPAANDASRAAASAPRRVYHLTDSGRLAVELDQRLEQAGHEIELLQDADELKEMLGALVPDIVIVDAAFQSDLESIGAALQATRDHSGNRILLLAISDEDSMQNRLAARRAGANALLFNPANAGEVLARLDDLIRASRDENYRILIVEDDRAQGLFAESILRNAGMDALVVSDAFEVLSAMNAFKPDMVLMDLYMPQCDGTELTALIREREEFLHTPIVFLSGESDQDKHFEALSVGGDDFLSKPIRPKHLIASVTNRVQRARALRQRSAAPNPVDPETGLYQRGYLLDRVNEALERGAGAGRGGGVLFIEVDNVSELRDRLGLSNVETLLRDLSRYIVHHIDAAMVVSRYGDACFVVLDRAASGAALETQGRYLHERVDNHSFIVAGQPIRLRSAVGVAAFEHPFADAGAVLNMAERICRQARHSSSGVARFQPARRAGNVHDDTLTLALRQAIESDALELLYQPIVALQGGEEARYQTLVRMRDDSGKLHTAAQIVPLAQQAGLLPALDRWVINHALRVIDERQTEDRPVKLFVSQSAISLCSPEHSEWLLNQIGARSTPGTSLVIELLAREVVERLPEVRAFCALLMPVGVQFCLSQYRSQAAVDKVLESLPVDFVKLDARYFEPSAQPNAREEIRLMVERTHRRGMSVIAPRVEDAQSAAQLWMSGIDYIQGNLVQLAGRDLEFDFQSAVL